MRLAIVNLKGGTAKTITAVHLAAGLAAEGRTLLVDADPQGSALAWSETAGDDFPCPVVGLPVRDLHRRLPELLEGFEHVVIDTPPGDAAIVRSAVLAAEVALIPMPPSFLDLDRLRPTLELIAELEPMHPIVVRIALTKVRQGTRSARATREVLADLGVPVLAAEVPLREAYVASFGLVPNGYGDYGAVLDEVSTTISTGALAR
jgi:chromosome partitioning protein